MLELADMGLEQLIDALRQPQAYPHPVDAVEVRQTHISVVFLAGPWAYKIKKPVDLGFLDFHTLELRHHYCEEEVRLNRRLAAGIYDGVVPIVAAGDGVRVCGDGEPIDYAVKMKRLPDDAQLLSLLERDELDAGLVAEVGRRLAAFHERANSSAAISERGRFLTVEHSVLDNFTRSRQQIGVTVSLEVFERVHARTVTALQRARPLIEARAARGVTRDLHGDLHLDHVYHFPERTPPDDLAIIDCIEFTTAFRYIDPVSDMAFLAMDLGSRGRRDLADALLDAYFEARDDDEGRELLPVYLAYRSLVRAKVDGITLREAEIPDAQRAAAGRRATAHWLYTLGELEPPATRPGLVLVAGLPGTGKSTLARRLAAQLGMTLISSDPVRKELAGLDPLTSATSADGEGIYTTAWTDRTYTTCLDRATTALTAGGRAIVDATFREDARRVAFVEAATRLGVRVVYLECEVEADAVHARLAARVADASDADIEVFERARARWEAPSSAVERARRIIDTGDAVDSVVERAAALLRECGLA